MNKKILSMVIVLGFFGTLFGQACSEYGAMNQDSQSSIDESSFNITSPIYNIAPSASVQLTANAGTPPYSWAVEFGGGTISQTGYYTAPANVDTLSTYVMISCTDSLGTTAHFSLSLNPNQLTASYSPNPAHATHTVIISVAGGTPPYICQHSVTGLINGCNYYPPTAETATIYVSDVKGLSKTLVIPILP